MAEMATLYKLTDENGYTRNRTQWGEGIKHKAKGEAGQDLCTDGWIHAYVDPNLAVLLNPIHAAFANPRLWEARGVVGKTDCGLKVGCRTLTTIREIPLPQWGIIQTAAFGILCSLEVYTDPAYVTWANRWLEGTDRSTQAAARAAKWAARAATATAAAAARAAAEAEAARAATATAAEAAAEAEAAKWAAAEAAAEAARAAEAVQASIHFADITKKALTIC